MKKFFFILYLMLSFVQLKAQKGEYGIFLGGSYYLGELNPSRHVVDVVNPAFGVILRHNINARYALKFNGIYGKLTGDDELTSIGLNTFRNLSFETTIIDASGQIEFNFLPYGLKSSEKPYTPYLFCGLSAFRVVPKVSSLETTDETAAAESYSADPLTSVAFPFGFGMKFMLKNGLNIGLEWSMRKTFTDNLDGINNQYEIGNTFDEPDQHRQLIGFQKGTLNTDDWYSFIGIIISYRKGPKKNACPAMN